MSQKNIGICDFDKERKRTHEYEITVDGEGREMNACKKCGNTPMKMFQRTIIRQRDDL